VKYFFVFEEVNFRFNECFIDGDRQKFQTVLSAELIVNKKKCLGPTIEMFNNDDNFQHIISLTL
jgi:hypothetical protein